MSRNYLHIFNCLNAFLPSAPFFSFRVKFLRCLSVKIGENVRINTGTSFYWHNFEVGSDVWIGPECKFFSTADAKISIGSRCDLAPGVMLVTGSHEMGNEHRRAGTDRSDPISVGDGCWIGARALILGGASIGSGCIIAAGAVVLPGNYPSNCLIAGVPGVIKRHL